MNTIREIVQLLESRVGKLITDFKMHNDSLEKVVGNDLNVNIETDPRCTRQLDAMITIFVELKPVARIVSAKHPELSGIFSALSKIEFERTNGKFFSFLSVMKRKYKTKPKLLPNTVE